MPSVRVLLTALAICAAPTLCAAKPLPDDLYAATVIVTGRDNLAERERGLGEALSAVLVRVSADPDVAQRFEESAVQMPADEAVIGLDYLDRKEGIQISDEQGARDRSFELTVTFRPAAIDKILAGLGAAPWPAPRPAVPVDLIVHTAARSYRLLAEDGEGFGQRLSLLDAADDLGLTIELPLADGPPEPGRARLAGDLRITPDGFWDSEWSFAGTSFVANGQSFDVTFENALAFAASKLRSPR